MKKLLVLAVLTVVISAGLIAGGIAISRSQSSLFSGTVNTISESEESGGEENSGAEADDTEEDVPAGTGEQSDEEAEMQESADAAEEETFTPVVVADNEFGRIVITGVDEDHTLGYSLNVELENRSSDKKYIFSIEHAAINSVSSDPFFAEEVEAGKTESAVISFTDADLETYHVGDPTDIELTFAAYDGDLLSDTDIIRETVHVYPKGQEQAAAYVREPQETDVVLAENGNVKITLIGSEAKDDLGYTLQLYLENRTDMMVHYSIEEASINGSQADPYWTQVLSAKTVGFTEVSWYPSILEAAGINSASAVTQVDFAFSVYDFDTFEQELLYQKCSVPQTQAVQQEG